MKRCLLSCFMVLVAASVQCVAQMKDYSDVIKDESWIKYLMVHPLHKFEAISKDAAYRLRADLSKKDIAAVAAEVDVTSFDSGNSNRDSHAMEVIDAVDYPDVTFTSTKVAPAGDDSLDVTGNLTFHGITRQIIVPIKPVWSPDKLAVNGSFNITLSEFKIDRPSLLMIPVSDTLKFTLAAAFNLK